MKPRRALLMLTAALLLAAAGCSSSSKSSGSSSATTASSGTAGGTCPFSGTTSRQTTAGGSTATTLSTVTSQRSGCIDQLTFFFGPGQPPSAGQYESSTGPVLVVHFAHTGLAGGVRAGAASTKGLEDVKSMDVATSGTDVVVTITLDKRRPFLMSATTGLSQVQLAIG